MFWATYVYVKFTSYRIAKYAKVIMDLATGALTIDPRWVKLDRARWRVVRLKILISIGVDFINRYTLTRTRVPLLNCRWVHAAKLVFEKPTGGSYYPLLGSSVSWRFTAPCIKATSICNSHKSAVSLRKLVPSVPKIENSLADSWK